MTIRFIDGNLYNFVEEQEDITSPYEETVESDEMAIFHHCKTELKNE